MEGSLLGLGDGITLIFYSQGSNYLFLTYVRVSSEFPLCGLEILIPTHSEHANGFPLVLWRYWTFSKFCLRFEVTISVIVHCP